MILVTVGTHYQPFDRLVRPMDELAAELEESVVIQCGCATYIPQYAQSFDFTTSEEMDRLTIEARVIVTHAASGAISQSLRADKPLVVVARLKRYGEHTDNHQLQLAKALEKQDRAIVVHDPSVFALQEAIEKAVQQNTERDESKQLVLALKQQLGIWSRASTYSDILTKKA